MDSLESLWQRPSPPDGPKKSAGQGLTASGRVLLAAAIVLVLLILLNMAKGFYSEWLWFSDLGYGGVFGTVLGTKILTFLVAAVAFTALFFGNVRLAMRLAPSGLGPLLPGALVGQMQRVSRWSIIAVTAVLSLIFGAIAQDSWLEILRFVNGQPFGVSDPLFSKDVAFYVFSLPFLKLIHGWLLGAMIATLLGTLGIYAISYVVQRLRFDFSRRVLAHVLGLGIATLGLFAWGYRLGIWELVFSQRGAVFGAGYADIHAKLPAQWTLVGVVVVCAALFGVAIVRRQTRWAAYGFAGWIGAAIIVGVAFPAIVQRIQVQPSELAREMPYIEYNIEFTREAFALDRVEEQPFPAESMPTAAEITDNRATIQNIRLWDHRPLLDTYNQIQSIRLYYDFADVDVDRYTLDGEYRQVMLSARELSAEKLASEAQTWVNRRLQFTHGYGIALSPVNEITDEGLPNLFVKDIPPVGVIEITRPEIYFGEKTTAYVIVGTNTEEFDYPSGDVNVYGRYQGESGVSLHGFVRRLIYAWQLGDFNLLISGELTPESRILYHRDIRGRVSRIAPFLRLDNDPYLVVMDGRLLWVQDAYTTTDSYPYSEPWRRGVNYIRNSVKVTIDAYSGDTTFYVADEGDALIRTYQAMFPGMFVPADQMSDYLKAHRRYPQDMFDIQSEVYRTYHMQDARVFYNKEDLWAVPWEQYGSQEQLMEPYYVTMRLPGEDRDEFLLMLPFTPVNKNNTIGWLAARSDGDNYGKLLAYHFPKERLVYGPSQIEDRIQQDTVITEQLALWGRGGSNIIRGNLLLVPIGNSNLYVEPVFLQAEDGGLPELKRVIVVAGDHIAMEPTLDESIAAIFGAGSAAPGPATAPTAAEPQEEPPPASELSGLVQQAQQHYRRAVDLLRAGDWAGYGQALEDLQGVLSELERLTTQQ